MIYHLYHLYNKRPSIDIYTGMYTYIYIYIDYTSINKRFQYTFSHHPEINKSMEFPSSGNMVGDMDMKSPNLQYQVLYILLMG